MLLAWILCLNACALPDTGPFRNVSTAEAAALLRGKSSLVVLDVRTSDEFAHGHLPGARLQDFYARDFEQKLKTYPRDSLYLVYCASGGRSTKVVKRMRALGFRTAYNLRGGFEAWLDAGQKMVLN